MRGRGHRTTDGTESTHAVRVSLAPIGNAAEMTDNSQLNCRSAAIRIM